MKILILLLIGLLSSCSTKVKEAEKSPDQSSSFGAQGDVQFSIATKIYEDKNTLSSPQVTVIEGQEATIRVIEERYLPNGWESPKTILEKGKTNLMPPTPTFDDPKEFGVTLQVKANKVNIKSINKTIHVQGKIVLTDSPVLQSFDFEKNPLLREHIHNFSDDICYYSLFIKDGASRKVKFKSGDKEYVVEFTVTEIDPTGLPKPGFKSGLPDFKRL